MGQLKLEVGKTYIDREGTRVTIEYKRASSFWPFWSPVDRGRSYNDDGRYLPDNGYHRWDLVREAPVFEVGKTYRTRRGPTLDDTGIRVVRHMCEHGGTTDTWAEVWGFHPSGRQFYRGLHNVFTGDPAYRPSVGGELVPGAIEDEPAPADTGLHAGRYCAYGHECADPDSPLVGDGKFPPFRVFDAQGQEFVGPEFFWRAHAQEWTREQFPLQEPVQPKEPGVPHEDLIRAALAGKTIQWRKPGRQDYWQDCADTLHAIRCMTTPDAAYEYRVKPATQVLWCAIWRYNDGENAGISLSHNTKEALLRELEDNQAEHPDALLRLEIDPDTLNVVDSRTESA